ncbi:hypothetical protein Y032_0568g46 [Ancylostoma ceylanicum]|uniref:Uncharacterized protein n=1 Tax=Ancylostoma ceylanicum TaxID=53326 RepID=A0A016WP70_9BILA|nr:hypothetical protein Y032_0568g46 [Ancylostoma ceylanicum]
MNFSAIFNCSSVILLSSGPNNIGKESDNCAKLNFPNEERYCRSNGNFAANSHQFHGNIFSKGIDQPCMNIAFS